jgi:hypothetical protein
LIIYFSIGVNSINSNNSNGIKPQLLFSILKADQLKINKKAIYAFPNGFKFSQCDVTPKIYAIFLKEEKDINEYLYI